MQLGMIGLGRMGANMVRRLLAAGHDCVVHDRDIDAIAELAAEGAIGATSLDEFAGALSGPRVVWIMLPVDAVDPLLDQLVSKLSPGDIVVDGGNSFYRDDLRRAPKLEGHGIHYVDCGTSGGVFGRERGYCLMLGGEAQVVAHIDPLLAALAPGPDGVAATPGRDPAASTATSGYLHCGPHGAGHFVKMVHNAIEYGLMTAYAEGFNMLRHAGIGLPDGDKPGSGEPARHPEHFQYDFPLDEIAELWRRGSVVTSWLLDLTAAALSRDSQLDSFSGHVGDSGEGRWALETALEQAVPVHVLAAALFQRFSSRGQADFQDRMLSAMRFAFGGHLENVAPTDTSTGPVP